MAAYTSVHASDFPVKSVSLYHPSTYCAKVTRTFSFKALNFSQQHIIEIAGLASAIDTDSITLRISGLQGNTHINSIQCVLDTHLLSDAPLTILRAQRLALENERHIAEEAASLLSAYMTNLTYPLSNGGPTFPTLDTLVSSLTEFVRIRNDYATTITAINERIALIDAQMQAETMRMRSHGTAMTRVIIVLASEGKSAFSDCELEMSYLVREVYWEPTYELRATTDDLGMQSESLSTSPTVNFRIMPCIRQSTGEFWDEVELSFSLVEQKEQVLYLPRQQRMKIRERVFSPGEWEDWPPSFLNPLVSDGHPNTPAQFTFNGRPTSGFSNPQCQVQAPSNIDSSQSGFQSSNGPRAIDASVDNNEGITTSAEFPKKKRRAKRKGVRSDVKVEGDSTLLAVNDDLGVEGIASKATEMMIDSGRSPGSTATNDTPLASLEQTFSGTKISQADDLSETVLEPPAIASQTAIEPESLGTRPTSSNDPFNNNASIRDDSEAGYAAIASVSVPTNGLPHLVLCNSTPLRAHVSRIAIPSVDKRVFYVCSVGYMGSSLLEGRGRVFLDDVHVADTTLIRDALGFHIIDCPLAVDNKVSVSYSCKTEMGCVRFPQTPANATVRHTVSSVIGIYNNHTRPLSGLIIRHALPVADDPHVQVVLRTPKDVANVESSGVVNCDVQADVHARWSSGCGHHAGSGCDWEQNELLEWVCNLRPLEEKKVEAVWDLCTPKNLGLQYQLWK